MKYTPAIKGTIKKSMAQPSPFQFAQDVGSVSILIHELQMLREDIINTANQELEKVDAKLAEVDSKLENVEQTVQEKLSIEKGEPGEDADEQKIADWVLSQIRQPEDGVSPDPEELVNEVLSRLPKLPNESEIIAKVLKAIPENKASLKIIQETMQVDEEVLIEKLIASPKLKLKVANIDGLKTTLDVLDRRYIHGGGDTVSAGSGIVINNVNGTKQISTLGGGFTILTTSDTIDDSNITFTFTGTPSLVCINGSMYNAGATSGGTVMWTNVGAVVTLAFPVGTGGSLFALA